MRSHPHTLKSLNLLKKTNTNCLKNVNIKIMKTISKFPKRVNANKKNPTLDDNYIKRVTELFFFMLMCPS